MLKSLVKTIPVEALIWFTGLLVLALWPVSDSGNHFSICPFTNLGLDFCPGCGLGRSITLLFRGEFSLSFGAHPLGIFAVIVLSLRIFQLIKNYLKLYGKSN